MQLPVGEQILASGISSLSGLTHTRGSFRFGERIFGLTIRHDRLVLEHSCGSGTATTTDIGPAPPVTDTIYFQWLLFDSGRMHYNIAGDTIRSIFGEVFIGS